MKLFNKKEKVKEPLPEKQVEEVAISNTPKATQPETPTITEIVINMTEIEYRTTILEALNEIILRLREK